MDRRWLGIVALPCLLSTGLAEAAAQTRTGQIDDALNLTADLVTGPNPADISQVRVTYDPASGSVQGTVRFHAAQAAPTSVRVAVELTSRTAAGQCGGGSPSEKATLFGVREPSPSALLTVAGFTGFAPAAINAAAGTNEVALSATHDALKNRPLWCAVAFTYTQAAESSTAQVVDKSFAFPLIDPTAPQTVDVGDDADAVVVVAGGTMPPADERFRSPSGNIRCVLKSAPRSMARCATRSPRRGAMIQRGARGRAVAFRALSGPARVLGYGKTKRLGPIRCTSEFVGMTCVDVRNGRGFQISREALVLLPRPRPRPQPRPRPSEPAPVAPSSPTPRPPSSGGSPYAGRTCSEIGHSYPVAPGTDREHDGDGDGLACESYPAA